LARASYQWKEAHLFEDAAIKAISNMGQLTTYLQQQFQAHCPPGWKAQREVRLLSGDLRRLLGYSPQVDVVLTHQSGRRLWIEFEFSRADPVANHAKFATAHLFQPQADTEVFLSMITSHVSRGRRNPAANTIWLMRYAGMQAYQTPLFPHVSPTDIYRLNHLSNSDLAQAGVDVRPEIQRALAVSQPLAQVDAGRIHFVANHMELMLNLYQWNEELVTAAGRQLWGRRTVTYFVYDPFSGRFAPSKFCAYVSIPNQTVFALPITGATMTMARYAQIDHGEPIFDGRRAHQHLTANLAMELVKDTESPELMALFESWLRPYAAAVNVHPAGPGFLVPPAWF
jgi:hypothetical protein